MKRPASLLSRKHLAAVGVAIVLRNPPGRRPPAPLKEES